MAMVQMEFHQGFGVSGAGDSPMKILDRGPNYFRERVLTHNSVLLKHHRKSAVELLEETKPLYVKGGRQDTCLTEEPSPWVPAVRRKPSDPGVTAQPANDAPAGGRLVHDDSPGKSAARRNLTSQAQVRPSWGVSQRPSKPSKTQGRNPPEPPPRTITYVGACSVKTPNKPSAPAKQTHPQVSTSTCGKQRPDSNVACAKDMMAGKAKCSSMADLKKETTASTTSLPVDPSAFLSPEDWRDTRTDTSSEIDKHSTNSLKVPIKLDDHNIVMVHRRQKKAIHRSRSDLTKRFSNSSDLSELSARFSRNSADLEKFFNEMGLDRAVLEPMMTAQWTHSSSDLHLFESCSSLDSPDGRSWCSGESGKHAAGSARLKPDSAKDRTPPQSAVNVVERNARIIKWLCSVKKATSQEED